MTYSNYPASYEPRTLRISFGSLLAIAALTYGLVVAVPDLQHSLTMKPAPQTLSWAELVRGGIGENSHVCLQGVDLHQTDDQLSSIQTMLAELDPQGDREAMKDKIEKTIRDIDVSALVSQSMGQIVVIPRGIDPARVPPVVVVSRFDPGLAPMREEVASDASITGYVRKGWDLNWVHQLASKVASRLDEKTVEKIQLQLTQYDLKPDLDQRPKYVISPVDLIPQRKRAITIVAACGVLTSLGLVIAGSGGPSFWSFILMPIPGLISLIGFPLRYGRGGFLTRALYLVFGLVALIGGYHLAWNLGGLMTAGGDTLLQSLGFVSGTFGLAALLGVVLNARAEGPAFELENRTSSYREPETGFSVTRTVAVNEPSEPAPANQYADPRLSDASEIHLPAAMDDQVQTLCANGFGTPKQLYVHDEKRRLLSTLFLGCHQTVLGEVKESGKSCQTRFVSVLSDGFVVVTLAASTPKISSLREGKNGMYLRSKSDSGVEILAEHLDRTLAIAEQRRSQVVPLDEFERLDVFLLGRRVLLDIQNEYKEAKWTIPKATYGRFNYPGQCVEMVGK